MDHFGHGIELLQDFCLPTPKHLRPPDLEELGRSGEGMTACLTPEYVIVITKRCT